MCSVVFECCGKTYGFKRRTLIEAGISESFDALRNRYARNIFSCPEYVYGTEYRRDTDIFGNNHVSARSFVSDEFAVVVDRKFMFAAFVDAVYLR